MEYTVNVDIEMEAKSKKDLYSRLAKLLQNKKYWVGNITEEENLKEREKQMRDKTCEEKIDESLKSIIEDVKEALVSANKNDGRVIIGDDEYEDLNEWLNNYALSYDDDLHYRAKKLELSWGGPSDYFLFFEDGTIEYYYLDWFDGAKRELEGEQKEIMEELYNRCLDF